MVRAAVVCWLGVLVFLGLLIFLPHPCRWFVWIPYGILLPAGVIFGNRRQRAVRQADAQAGRTKPDGGA